MIEKIEFFALISSGLWKFLRLLYARFMQNIISQILCQRTA